MMWHEAINALWLYIGPTDEPAVNAFSFAAGLGIILWIAIPVGLIVWGVAHARGPGR